MSEYEMGWQAGKDHAEQEHQGAVEQALAADRLAALRDVFAAAAMSALIARNMTWDDGSDGLARDAYHVADVMLKVRGT